MGKGLSTSLVPQTMSEVAGYSKDAFKGGNVGVVLAKYVGGGKATPGYELVATDVWK